MIEGNFQVYQNAETLKINSISIKKSDNILYFTKYTQNCFPNILAPIYHSAVVLY